jgi:predicted short-subunit dehydrogenase-like oxidoreductase (DUF2520 family)
METISFIGSGHAATHLAKAFFAQGYLVVDICSPTPGHAQKLAGDVNARPVTHVRDLHPADVYIIAVDDRSIPAVVQELKAGDSLVLHTAGSVNMSILQRFPNYGILYPLQTLCQTRNIDIKEVPLFVEANIQKNLDVVLHLAHSVSNKVRISDSTTRSQLHLAAVFAANFVNSLLSIAHDIAGDDFVLLKPLVRETIEKAFAAGYPAEVQTGPARRRDDETINKQIALLSSHPDWQEIYRLLTENIIKQTK